VADLKKQIDDLRENPDEFQVYDLPDGNSGQQGQISYALSRHKGQNDSLFYMNDTAAANAASSRRTLPLACSQHFFALGQFLAVAGEATDLSEGEFTNRLTVGWTYPVCAVGFSFRKKGQPTAQSMKMLFIGLKQRRRCGNLHTEIEATWVHYQVADPLRPATLGMEMMIERAPGRQPEATYWERCAERLPG